ncbi:MAG: YbaK/EbsC family protein [Candidatus Aenigmarchaeota archaeon]|nr:YbaK/EbsC family protein [Candidatus Aenigmarchaeota archaeon]
MKSAEIAAKSAGINLDGIVKSLLFKAGNDFCLIIIQGSKKASSRKLRKLLNEENVRLASPEEVLEVTGFSVGAVPPIGLKSKIKCIMDKTVLIKEKVWAGGGATDRLVHLKVDDIIKYHNPRIGDVSE